MKKHIITIFLLLLGVLSTFSQSDHRIPFQGKLYQNGQPANGQFTFTFAIQNGGVSWTENHLNVEVSNGLYSVALGEEQPLPDNLFQAQPWHDLSILVNGNPLDVVKIYAPYEVDPTVPDLLKDGVQWPEIEGVPPNIDTDVTNELQVLSISGDTLYISNGNFVVLSGQESFGLPFEVGTSDTIIQEVASFSGGANSHIRNSVWQSFLPYVDGRVTSIRTVFNNISNGSITLKIYKGEGVGSQFIASFSFSAGDYPPLVSPGSQTFNLPSPVTISTGQKYTFEITGNAGSGGNGNLEFITSGTSNPYSFGQSSIGPDIDLQFTITAEVINEFSLVVSQTGSLAVPNGRVTDKTGYLMPVGAILPFAGPKENVPEGFFLCEGQCLDKSVYPELHAAIGDNWGTCSDQTLFRLPDLRGTFLRGVSHESNRDPDKEYRIDLLTLDTIGNKVGSYQENGLKIHEHSLIRVNTTAWGVTTRDPISTGVRSSVEFDPESGLVPMGTKIRLGISDYNEGPYTAKINIEPAGSSEETRPYNAYVNYIIKY